MWETILLLAFSLLVVLGSLGALVWVIVTGQMFEMDGLLLVTICLMMILVFGMNFLSTLRSGGWQQLREVLARKKSEGGTEKKEGAK